MIFRSKRTVQAYVVWICKVHCGQQIASADFFCKRGVWIQVVEQNVHTVSMHNFRKNFSNLSVPMMPIVLPYKSLPTRPFNMKLPSRVLLYAWWIFLFNVCIRATAYSATACGEYAGTRTTCNFCGTRPASQHCYSRHSGSVTSPTPSSYKISATSGVTMSFTNTHTASCPFCQLSSFFGEVTFKKVKFKLYVAGHFFCRGR